MTQRGQGDVVGNAAYLREWAADIRKSSGKSVDADKLDSIAAEIDDLKRTARNRDMWQGQCERQADELTRLRTLLSSEQGWRTIDDDAAKRGRVLVGFYNAAGKWRTIKAEFIRKHTVETENEWGEAEDVDENGTAYVPEGWYECVEAEDVPVERLGLAPTHWMPLPSPPGSVPTSLAGQGTDDTKEEAAVAYFRSAIADGQAAILLADLATYDNVLRELGIQESHKHPVDEVRRIQRIAETAHPQGVEAAAKLIDRKVSDYTSEHGSLDPETGAMEFSRSGEEYVSTLEELAEEIRAINTAAPQPTAGGDVPWECNARVTNYGDPKDCNWPYCGCDPHAERVMKSAREQGWHSPGDFEEAEAEHKHALSAERARVIEECAAIARRPRIVDAMRGHVGVTPIAIEIADEIEALRALAQQDTGGAK